MAQTNKEVFGVFGFLSILLLIQKGHAFEFKVGGSKGWTVPTDPNAAMYNQWAEKNRFQIGDTLCKFTFLYKYYAYNHLFCFTPKNMSIHIHKLNYLTISTNIYSFWCSVCIFC